MNCTACHEEIYVGEEKAHVILNAEGIVINKSFVLCVECWQLIEEYIKRNLAPVKENI